MKLIPTSKQKKRYVLFEIIGEGDFSSNDVEKAVSEILLEFLGQLGVSRAEPIFVKERFSLPHFVVKVAHNYVDELRAGVILIKKIKNRSVIIRSVKTSGTLKKLEKSG